MIANSMRRSPVLLVICGILVHIICFSAIADIYFRSKVVHGMESFSCSLEALARRVVFIVSDGLRADNFFDANNTAEGNAPYLRSIIKKRGTWGVLHTRAPTESRPTHVAMFSGFYEDPATLFKRFKSNPVEFDSIFNQSRNAWLWSSVDFVDTFKNGPGKGHIQVNKYSLLESNIELDEEGFLNIINFFMENGILEINNAAINEDKIIFFLHLQGTDDNGHNYKPFSKFKSSAITWQEGRISNEVCNVSCVEERLAMLKLVMFQEEIPASKYIRKMSENIWLIDENIKRLEEIIEQVFNNDHKTAYFFTSDHGMTSDGDHGQGSKNETQLPLIAWGAGIHSPRLNTKGENSTPSTWLLSDIARLDTESITIAPLLASLMGIPIPVNSMGALPHAFLNVSERHLSCMMLSNTLQMFTHFRRKKELAGRGILLPKFPLLDHQKAMELLSEIHILNAEGNYNESIKQMKKLIELSTLGIVYYDNFNGNILLCCTTLSFVLWMALLLQLLFRNDNNSVNPGNRPWLTILWILFAILVIGAILVENLPYHFCVYGMLPVFLSWAVANNGVRLFILIYSLNFWNILQGAFYLFTVQIMVMSTNARCFISIGMLGLSLWPIMPLRSKSINKPLTLGWISSCLSLALFPLLPVIKDTNRDLLIVSALLLLFMNCTYVWQTASRIQNIVLIQMILTAFATLNVLDVDLKLKEIGNNEKGLALHYDRILSWILSGLSIFLPLLSSRNIRSRLFSLQLSLCVPLLLLSSSYEGLFFLLLVLHMCSWFFLEVHTENCKWSDISFNIYNKVSFDQQITSQDVRRTCFYMMISFLGLHSLESAVYYKRSWVQCFVGVEHEFITKLLILIKVLLFMSIPTATFYILSLVFQAPMLKLHIVFLLFTQAIAVQLQYFVNNHGSWKEIGLSIAIYAIFQFCSIAFVLLYGLTKFFIHFSLKNHK